MADKKISALPTSTLPLSGSELVPIVQSGTTKQVSASDLTRVLAGSTAETTTLRFWNTKAAIAADEQIGKIEFYSSDASTPGPSVKAWLGAFAKDPSPEAYISIAIDTATGTPTERVRFTETGNVNLYTGNLVIGTAGKGIDFSANAHTAGMTSELLDDYEEGTWTPTFYGSGTAGTYTPSVFRATYTKVGRLVTARADFNFSAASGGTGDVRLAGLPFTYNGQNAMPAVVSTSSVDTTTASGLGLFINQSSSGTDTQMFMYQCLDATTQEQVPISGISTNSRIAFVLSYEVLA